MISLDEAIKHCEEVAEKQEIIAIYTPIEMLSSDVDIEKCQECASEHRQLADWLRELKLYRDTLIDRPCSACKFKKDNGCCKWACVFERGESK